jgi:hypothetical protein
LIYIEVGMSKVALALLTVLGIMGGMVLLAGLMIGIIAFVVHR